MQAEHQQAVLGLCPIQRRFKRDAAAAGLEFILKRPLVIEQGLGLHFMHGIRDSPEPEISFRQRLMQRLGARHRDETLLVGAAE